MTKRFVERLHTRAFGAIAEAWFLDAALQYSGAPATTIGGLWHLVGETVWALADGIVRGPLTVSAALVTVGKIIPDADLELLDIDGQDQAGTWTGRKKKINHLTVALKDSANTGLVAGPSGGQGAPTLYALKPKDLSNLVMIQRNISARDGVPIEGVGYPLGTLGDHAELATHLLTGNLLGVPGVAGRIAVVIARQAYRASRWALEKIRKSDEPPVGKDVPANERLNPTGVVGGAAKAAEIALSTAGTSVSQGDEPSRQAPASRPWSGSGSHVSPSPITALNQIPTNAEEEKRSPTLDMMYDFSDH